jgi:hypothetical protein
MRACRRTTLLQRTPLRVAAEQPQAVGRREVIFMMTDAVVNNGRTETAKANRLCERQAEAVEAVRKRYRRRLASARGLR